MEVACTKRLASCPIPLLDDAHLPPGRHVEIRLPVSGRERYLGCHPERSEGSLRPAS